MPAKKVHPRPWRRILEQIHLWIGMILCIPLVILGITGSILVYGHDLEHLLGPPEPRATTGEYRAAGEIIAAAKGAAPPGFVPTMLRMPREAGEPAGVRLAPPARRGAAAPANPFVGSIRVLIDPVSLAVLGNPEPPPGWLRLIHNLHGSFLLGRDGRAIVGWFGVVMLALGASGLVLWWPRPGRWLASFRVRKGARGYRLHRDLHGAVGIWSLAVFMVVSFSGVYLAFPQTTGALINMIFPGRDLRAAFSAQVTPLDGAAPMEVDEAIALALETVADARLMTVVLPSRPTQPIRVSMVRDDVPPAPTVTVLVDPWTRNVVDAYDPKAFSAGESIVAWQRALHYGLGFGEVYKFLVFLSGLIIPLFAVTGIAMWLLKRRARAASAADRAAALRSQAAAD